MIFVIKNLKYDTDKMELISKKCKHKYKSKSMLGTFYFTGKDVKLWKSSKGNWLLTYNTDYNSCGKTIDESEAKNLLLQYDLEKYEEIFGELEEA